MPFTAGNKLTILNNGDEFFPAILNDIALAERSVTIEGYIYWAGDIGTRFAHALAERARRGITVKVLLDAIGSATIGDEVLKVFEAGGVQVAWFNTIRWYTLERSNHRTHRKSIVIDGRVGYTGGAGIADQWLGHAQDAKHWRDQYVRIEGPGCVPLQSGFATNWLITTGELVTGPRFFPKPVEVGEIAVQTLLSSPIGGASSLRVLYYLSIACAARAVLIANPYFVPDPVAIDLLADASRRGVTVNVLLSGRSNDSWLARHNSVRLYGRLLEAGVRIHEYMPTMLHYKAMVVDSCWATVGTCNFDDRSFALNEESNVSWHDASLVAQFEGMIRDDLNQAREVSLGEWRKRSGYDRAQELIASVFQEQV